MVWNYSKAAIIKTPPDHQQSKVHFHWSARTVGHMDGVLIYWPNHSGNTLLSKQEEDIEVDAIV